MSISNYITIYRKNDGIYGKKMEYENQDISDLSIYIKTGFSSTSQSSEDTFYLSFVCKIQNVQLSGGYLMDRLVARQMNESRLKSDKTRRI